MAEAILYDGGSALRHKVDIALAGDVLVLAQPDWRDEVPVDCLSVSDRSAAGLTLLHADRPGWRLRIPAPVAPEVARRFAGRAGYGRWVDRIGLWGAAAVFSAASAAVLTIGYFAPTLLAPLVPQSVERAYGAALVGDYGGKHCSSPAGDAALRKLTARLDPSPGDLNVRVVAVPMVNAAALPAGNIMIFEGLFRAVDSPDELAGILAHEIAHVRHRHVTAALLREFGVGIFTTALGGTTAGRVDGFVALGFTRRAEGEADDDAIARLNRAGISPRPTSGFFKRLGRTEGKMGRFEPAMAYLSSHPMSKDREAKFVKAERRDVRYTPAMTPEDWAALKSICARRPKKKS